MPFLLYRECTLKVQYFFASSNYVVPIIDTDDSGYYPGHICGYKIQELDIKAAVPVFIAKKLLYCPYLDVFWDIKS